MKRAFSLSSVIVAAGLFALGATPALSQGRPAPSGGGSGEHAVSRPSGGESSSPSGGGSSGSSTSSGGGSSMGSSGGGDHAVSRGSSGDSRRGGGTRGSGSGTRGGGNPRSVVLPSGPSSSDPGDRSTPAPGVGEYARPRGDRPVSGRAVPRDISNVPDLGWRRDPYWAYDYYRYSHWTPFYYGAWGGYMYYDPYWWDYYYGYTPGYYGGGGGGYSQSDYEYDTGSLKLKVRPRDAQVYVDGYFSGVVDEYDGVMQKLKLRAGAHRVELRAEGYQPSIFEVLIVEGETVTYRGELKPKP